MQPPAVTAPPIMKVLGPAVIEEPRVYKTSYDVCSTCNSPSECTCEDKRLKRVYKLHWNEKKAMSPPPTDEEYAEEITKLKENLQDPRVPCFYAKINMFSEIKQKLDNLKEGNMSEEDIFKQLEGQYHNLLGKYTLKVSQYECGGVFSAYNLDEFLEAIKELKTIKKNPANEAYRHIMLDKTEGDIFDDEYFIHIIKAIDEKSKRSGGGLIKSK